MKRILGLILALLVLLGGVACAESAQPALEKDVVVLFTSDVHCGIDQGFGYAGLVAIRSSMEAAGNHVLLVDNGDSVQGEPIGTMTTGEALIELMNTVGYDIAVPGNHEFDYGMERFLELTGKASFPYISANFNKDGELVFAPYVIKEFDGVKVAFVGVTTPKTLTSSTPKYFQDEAGNFIYGFMQDETGEKLYAAVQSAVDAARAEGAAYVVVLGHLGNEDSCSPWTYADVIANTTGIDALLDGHSHDTDQVEMLNKDGQTVLRSACGTKMAGVGCLRIGKDGKLSTDLFLWNNSVAAPELLGIRNDVYTAVKTAQDALTEKLSEVVARTAVELTINDPVATKDDGSPIRIVRRAETNLGDLCADAYRDQSGAQIAFVNGGGVRVSIKEGDITLGNILKVHPFGNAMCVIEATGAQILDALEWGARAVPSENGGFLQVSGLTYEIHTYIESSAKADENTMFAGVEGEYRVKNVMVGGEPLDPEKTYTLASHNYMLKNGGDGYSMFKGCKLLQDEVMLDNQVLINYITGTLGGVVGEQYANPYGEGRIVAVEEKPAE
ncbi:MAG: bifunctional metallophosphatase/5'-nucleotidase [Clostridiales bacterium]|nr:bifunctional metallophosphatase/5'-nucleotidase [Clostridiales bacterium]